MNRMTIPKDLAEWNRMGDGHLPGLLGIEVLQIDDEMVHMRLVLREALLAGNGFLHAASVVALADTACGYGTVHSLPEDAVGFTTLELKSNFLGTAREGHIECVASPLHRGRTTQVWEADVQAEGRDKTIARFHCTQLILR